MGKPQAAMHVADAALRAPQPDGAGKLQHRNGDYQYADPRAGCPASDRTLTVQVLVQRLAPVKFSEALYSHLVTMALQFGFRDINKQVTLEANAGTKMRFDVELDTWDHARALRDFIRREPAFTHGGYSTQGIQHR